MSGQPVGGMVMIDTAQLRALGHKLGAADKVVTDELTGGMLQVGHAVRDAGNARINHWSHDLENSATVKVTANRFSVTALIQWGKGLKPNYAPWVNFGRGWVYPIRANFLRWVARDGTIVFAKKAKPAPAQHFAEKGADDAGPKIHGIMLAVAGRIANRVVR